MQHTHTHDYTQKKGIFDIVKLIQKPTLHVRHFKIHTHIPHMQYACNNTEHTQIYTEKFMDRLNMNYENF